MKAVEITMERKFAEEIEFFEGLKVEILIAETFTLDYSLGINSTEVEERRLKYGTNKEEAVESKTRILLAASAFSIILGISTDTDYRNIAWIEGFANFVAVMISSNFQAFNDFQKEKQIRKLNNVADSRKTLSVIRDGGKVLDLHQSELVSGDIININEGTDIPADVFVLEAHGFAADESAMTVKAMQSS